ncbi:MAG: bifunctional nuclease family protein [Ilumatobacteraceae bacterium]
MIPMEVAGVRVELPANTPMVVLREQDGRHRLLPIMIGSPEASAIHNALEGIVPQRPLTHDLVVNLFEALGAQLDSVVVTEVREHTFYAELHLRTAAGELVVSSRPSDALALAVRTGTPIFANEDLLDEAALDAPDEIAEQEEEAILDEFRDFLEEIKPEDFEA